MVVSVERVARRYINVTAGTPVAVDIPAFTADEVFVYYGKNGLTAVHGADYTLALALDFNTITVTPTSALIAKINALIAADPTETNFITVRRQLDHLTEATAAGVRYTQFTAREFDRLAMRDQQLEEQLNRALTLGPQFVGDAPKLQLNEVEPGRALIFNADGTAIEAGPDVADLDAAASAAVVAVAAADAAALYAPAYFEDYAEMMLDDAAWAAGTVLNTRARGHVYRVAPVSASDQNITRSDGVKLYVLPLQNGCYTPFQWGAVGDGVASDATAFLAASAVATAAGVPLDLAGGVFAIGANKVTVPMVGAGGVAITGTAATDVADGMSVVFDPSGSNVYCTPNIWAETANGTNSSPGGIGKYFNVVVAPGSNVREAAGNVWRSVLMGAAVGERITEWERVEAIGNGAMRFAPLANRVTAVGSIVLQWLGAPDQTFLRNTSHDFWLDTLKPGDAGWDFFGLETRNPGIGAYLHAFTDYATTTEQCSSLVAIGRDAGLHTIRDEDSVYIGYQAGTHTFAVLQNVAVGARALRDGVKANRCVALGRSAGFNFQDGTSNIYVGNIAGSAHVRGSYSMFFGEQAGEGLGADVSNTLVVQNRVLYDPLVLGDFAASRLGVGVSSLAVLDEMAGRGFMVSAPGTEAAPTIALRWGNTAVTAGQSYGQFDFIGRDNQGAGVRARMSAVAVGTLGAADLVFYTQPASTMGSSPTEVMSVRNNGSVKTTPRATAPSAPTAGEIYYDSATNKHRGYNGTAWFDMY